jgi:hypothetical protein
MKSRFSKDVAAALSAAGWFPGRGKTRNLRSGAGVPDAVRAFVVEFGGLTLPFVRQPTRTLDEVRIYREVSDSGDEYHTTVYAGCRVYAVGDVYRRHMYLLMSADGSLYGEYDTTVVRFGRSPEEFFERIVRDEEPSVILPIPGGSQT